MKATEIIDVARTLQRDATGPLRGYGDIPVFVARCRGMRDEIVAHPLNGIANTGRDLRRRKRELVNGDADCLRPTGERGLRHRADDAQHEESRTHRYFLFQRLSNMLGVLLMTLEDLETGGQKVLQLGIARSTAAIPARRNNGRRAAFQLGERICQLVAGRISRARILIRARPIKARKPIAAREIERRRQGAEGGVLSDAVRRGDRFRRFGSPHDAARSVVEVCADPRLIPQLLARRTWNESSFSAGLATL